MQRHPFAPVLVLAATLASLSLTGCASRTQRTFPEADARASEVLALLGDEASAVATDPAISDQVRDARLRYIRWVRDAIIKADLWRADLMTDRTTLEEARVATSALILVYDHMAFLARYPGRLSESGEPADKSTAEALAGTEQAFAAIK